MSAFAVIDPMYSAEGVSLGSDALPDDPPWLYGECEFECGRLAMLQSRVKAAGLNVGYPGDFHVASERVWFRHRVMSPASVEARVNGSLIVRLDEKELYRGAAGVESHVFSVGSHSSMFLVLEITSPGDVPALLIENGEYSTGAGDWEWSDDAIVWSLPMEYHQVSSRQPPHLAELGFVRLCAGVGADGLVDFGLELFGRLEVEFEPEFINVGESVVEAMNQRVEDKEQPVDMFMDKDGKWRSKNPLAFRYVHVDGAEGRDVACLAEFYPATYRGAFACSDPLLSRIWMNSAYTQRLCMRDFMLDGIKRDRLPWVGDLVMSMMANACAFGDAEILRRTLRVLGRGGIARHHLNGIIDYSLWWVIAHEKFQLYFGDVDFLGRQWLLIREHMRQLLLRCDDLGMLKVESGDWLFVDWVDGDKLTALQILWYWTLKSAASLAGRLNEGLIAREWRERAGMLAMNIYGTAWDYRLGLWRSIPGKVASGYSRHAHIFGVLSGMSRTEMEVFDRDALLLRNLSLPGTPYMTGFECMALALLGEAGNMLERLRTYWGGMLKRGATTFWEAYDPECGESDTYAFYGRPFGKSLCHAWSAAPVVLLSQAIWGLEILEDGWKRFALKPELLPLSWAGVCVPTPRGNVEIAVKDGRVTRLKIPDGCVCVYPEGWGS